MKSLFTKKRMIWSTVILLLLIVVGVPGYYAYSIYHFGKSIGETDKDSPFQKFQPPAGEEDKNKPPEWNGTDRVNVLLLGGDSRGLRKDEVPRSDTMMIASLDPNTKQAYLFSVLRDSYVDIPDHGQDRINAALALGGPELAMKTVSEWLNLPIQYYIYVDFQGFIKLIDALGGIDFYVEKNMYYNSRADGPEYTINLKKGYQHMDGNTALQYVRFRHDALSDYARTERQRNFMTAVAKKMQSFSSILKLPNTLKQIEPYIQTNLSLRDMWSLGNLGKKSDTGHVVTAQLPPTSLLTEETVGGASVIAVDQAKLQAYVQEKFAEDPAAAAGTDTSGGTNSGGSTSGSADSSTDNQTDSGNSDGGSSGTD